MSISENSNNSSVGTDSTRSNTTLSRYESQLDLHMIKFITSCNRLFCFDWLSIWEEFRNEYCQYEITAENLYQKFIDDILPEIFLYRLSEEQRRYIGFLNKYPNIEQRGSGFHLQSNANLMRRFLRKWKEDKDYSYYTKNSNAPIVFISYKNLKLLESQTCGNPAVHAWASYIVSTPEEKVNRILLPYRIISERFKKIQRHITEAPEVLDLYDFETNLREIEKDNRFFEELNTKVEKATTDFRKNKRHGD